MLRALSDCQGVCPADWAPAVMADKVVKPVKVSTRSTAARMRGIESDSNNWSIARIDSSTSVCATHIPLIHAS